LPTFRTFRNSDPPAIRELWNDRAQHARGCAWLSGCDHLEQFIFSKPYFDRNGLIVALEGKEMVGFCLSGFASDESGEVLDRDRGAICLLVVHEEHRRQGIGRELVRLSRDYLSSHGAKEQFLGAMPNVNPFGLGIYGGADSPGILQSDQDMVAFAQALGCEPVEHVLVMQLNLESEIEKIEDARLPLLRRTARIYSESFPEMDTWWQAATVGSTFCYRYDLVIEQDRDTEIPVGAAIVWDMDTFSTAWNVRAFGFSDFFIEPAFRRKGYAKLFMQSILKHLRDNRVGLLEIQIEAHNAPGRAMLEMLHFEKVDSGSLYRLPAR
jgi:GNAT superfamily N-acetyltransferase